MLPRKMGSCGDAPGNKYFDPAILHNGKFEKTKGYCTDVFFSQAIQWIRRDYAEPIRVEALAQKAATPRFRMRLTGLPI